jgi:hypothetical protein
MTHKQSNVFMSVIISRVCGGLLQEEYGTHLKVFGNEPTKSQGAPLRNFAILAIY